MKLFEFIFRKKYVSFHIPYTIDEASNKLNDKLTNFWEDFDKSHAMGKAKNNKVFIKWHNAGIRNSFNPVFKGKFRVENEKTILDGTFSLHLIIKIFLTIWFGALFVMTIFETFIILSQDSIELSKILFFYFFISLMFIGTYTIIWFGQNVSKNNLNEILKFINNTIGNPH